MRVSLWLWLLTTLGAVILTTDSFDLDPEDFFSIPAPKDEALAFFKKRLKLDQPETIDDVLGEARQLDDTDDEEDSESTSPASKRQVQSNVSQALTPQVTATQTRKKKHGKKKSTVKSGETRGPGRATEAKFRTGAELDPALESISSQQDLLKLSNGIFNGNKFKLRSDVIKYRPKFEADFQRPNNMFIDLPGDFTLHTDKSDANKIPLSLTPPGNTEQQTFANTVIGFDGVVDYKGLGLNIPITINKAKGADVYAITNFAVADKIGTVLANIDKFITTLSSLIGQDLNIPNLDVIQNQLKSVTGFGAFDKTKLQIVVQWANNKAAMPNIPITAFSILLETSDSPDESSAPFKFAIFAQADKLIPLLTENLKLFKDFELAKGIMNSISSTACLFVTKDEMQFLQPIKTHAKFKSCFGNQQDATNTKPKEMFMKVPPGLHLHLEFDMEKVFTDHCEVPKKHPLLKKLNKISIYANLTRTGLDIEMLNEVEVPTPLLKQCALVALANAPGYLTDGTVVIKYVKIGGPDDFKLGVRIQDFQIPWSEAKNDKISLDLDVDRGIPKAKPGQVPPRTAEWNLKGKTSRRFGTSQVDISFAKNGQTYDLAVSSEKILLSDIIETFGIALPEGNLFESLGIKDFKLSYSKTVGKQDFKIRGSPIMFGYDGIQISAVLSKPQIGAMTWAISVYMSHMDFDPVMKNLFGKTDISMKWLQGVKAIVVVSNEPEKVMLKQVSGSGKRSELDRPKSKDHREKRSAGRQGLQKALKRGPTTAQDNKQRTTVLDLVNLDTSFAGWKIIEPLHFGVKWVIPDNPSTCYNSKLCEWCVNNLGQKSHPKEEDKSFELKGQYGSKVFKLEASANFHVVIKDGGPGKDKLWFKNIGMSIEVGATTPKFTLSVELEYDNPEIGATGEGNTLIFRGAIEATPTSISLVVSMENYIYPTKISTYVAFGNMFLKVGITASLGLPNFAAGLAVKIGKDVKNHPENAIEVRGAFGVSPDSPEDNWFYGSISALTVEKVCTAFDLGCGDDMSPALKKTGFPNGITVSYSGKKRKVVGVKEEIPRGLKIKGNLNLFDYEVKCYLLLTTQEINMEIEMSPIDWANGLVQIRRTEKTSAGEKKSGVKGPIAIVKFPLTKTGEFLFYIGGYINLFNVIKMGVEVNITNTQFKCKLEGYLIPAFLKVELELTATYGSGKGNTAQVDDDSPLFSFVATVTPDFLDTLKRVIQEFMEYLREQVNRVRDQAQAGLDAANAKLDLASGEVEKWRGSIKSWEADLNKEKERLRLEAEAQKKPCTCQQVCFPFFDWNAKCWKVWGYWVGCPWFNTCFKMIDDVFCMARCAIKEVISSIVRWVKQAILSIGVLILKGVNALTKLVDGVIDLAKGVVAVAGNVVDLIAKGINSALKEAQDWLIEKIKQIELHFFKFDAKLTADYSACVGYEYSMKFFGSDAKGKGEACLDLKSMTSTLIGSVTEKNEQTKGTTTTPEKLKEIETEQGEVTKAKDKCDKEYTKAEKEQKEKKPPQALLDEAKKKGGRHVIPKLKEYAKRYKNVPTVVHVPTKNEAELIEWSEKKYERYNLKADPKVRAFTAEAPYGLPDQHIPRGHEATVEADPTETAQRRSLDFDSNMHPCDRMKRALTGYTDLVNGILTYSEAIRKSHRQMENATNAEAQKLEIFRRHIDDADMAHNMTERERDEMYFVYNHLAAHQDELAKKSSIAMQSEEMHALPIIRRQINHLLRKEKGTNFLKFTDLMHTNAIEGYKRSGIPHPSDENGERILQHIKQDTQAIVTYEGSSLAPVTSRVIAVKKNIIAMSEYTKQCNGK